MHDDFEFYALNNLKIRPKDGGLIDFKLSKAQRYLHTIAERQLAEKGFIRLIILKGRQLGISTYIDGRQFWRVTQNRGVRAFILTHAADATNNLFDMTKRFYENCMEEFKPSLKASNAKELAFDLLDSGYKIGTAGNESVGRSSTIQYLHASEAAFFSHAAEHAGGIMQTVPMSSGTEIFIESTANGVGNWFHQQWLSAEAGASDFIPVFLPWHWQDEYTREVDDDFYCTSEETELKKVYNLTDGQIMWRRIKIAEMSVDGIDGNKLFKQEYPLNASEAFQASSDDVYIDAFQVMKARKNNGNHIEAIGKRLCGLDIARFGDDRTVFCFRQGRVVTHFKSYTKIDTMQVAGIAHSLLETGEIDKMFIDVGGLGSGVYDRLVELGWKKLIISVNSATRALDENKFANKRAEMWAKGRAWLFDEPCILPDSNELHADLCNTRYKLDSKGRLLMESKAEMKSRGVRSSDCADAFLLTFAEPVSMLEENTSYDEKRKVEIIMHSFNVLNRKKR